MLVATQTLCPGVWLTAHGRTGQEGDALQRQLSRLLRGEDRRDKRLNESISVSKVFPWWKMQDFKYSSHGGQTPGHSGPHLTKSSQLSLHTTWEWPPPSRPPSPNTHLIDTVDQICEAAEWKLYSRQEILKKKNENKCRSFALDLVKASWLKDIFGSVEIAEGVRDLEDVFSLFQGAWKQWQEDVSIKSIRTCDGAGWLFSLPSLKPVFFPEGRQVPARAS